MSKDEDEREEGQVSAVSGMEPQDADTPISDGQSVAGNPDAPDVGEAGPNANPHRKRDTR